MTQRRRETDLSDLAQDRERALTLTRVSREIAERLDRYADLLLTWQKTTNLVGDSTVHTLWTRHFVDSLQFLDLAPEARIWVDFGSGAGFPGLVIACGLVGTSGAQVHLVESAGKKAAFLREAIRTLSVPAIVHAQRIEDFTAQFEGPVDVVTARALAPLRDLLTYADPLLKKGAKALFAKGQDVEMELTDSSKCWNIDYWLAPSRTSARSCIVAVNRAERLADPSKPSSIRTRNE